MAVTIDSLLNLVPTQPDVVLQHLQSRPDLASAKDYYGYSLLHAAASYNETALLTALVKDHHVDVNIRDEDNETPLFACENVDIARTLIEELRADVNARNDSGQTAGEKIEAEEEFPLVAAYLREAAGRGSSGGAASVVAQTGGAQDWSTAQAGTLDGADQSNGIHPPPMPQGMDVKIGTMAEPSAEDGEPDPEFRRRIEELAARDDFQSEEGQRQLRELVEDAIGGMGSSGQGNAQRRRMD